MERIHDAAVIGAGLSGLSAGRRLAQAGLDVAVLEKSRGPGGRASTRRLDLPHGSAARIDHGAQFFTVRDPMFRLQAEDWLARGVCREWASGFETWDGGRLLPPDPRWDARRYACPEGMNSLGKDLASGLAVRSGLKVVAVRQDEEGWLLTTDRQGPAVRARALFCSSPVPQSLDLIADHLSPAERERLARRSYAPCLAVMAVYGPQTAPPPWKAIQVRDEASPLSWLARDSSKRASGRAPLALVLHSAPGFSRECGQEPRDREAAAARMLAEAARIAGGWVQAPAHTAYHWWRYALPSPEGSADGFHRSTGGFPLYLIGDAFQGGRIEGAWLSGRKAAEDFLRRGS